MTIFVFGSNLSGHHGKGAALCAKERYGARQHNGTGIQGNAYAIPTKGARDDTRQGDKYPILPLPVIAASVRRFLDYARQNPQDTFLVTRIGCGLASYKDEKIAPLFEGASGNCFFDPVWKPFGLSVWSTPPFGFQPKGSK